MCTSYKLKQEKWPKIAEGWTKLYIDARTLEIFTNHLSTQSNLVLFFFNFI